MDYYKLLGIAHTASLREAKVAYRKLALIYHPDVTGNDKQKTEHFKKIKFAFDCIEKGIDNNSNLSPNQGRHQWNPTSRRYEKNPSYTMHTSRTQQQHRVRVATDSHQFNTKVWSAWHYGDDAIIKDAVTQTKKPDEYSTEKNKHARYHQRMYERDRREAQHMYRQAEEKRVKKEKLTQDEIIAKMRFRSDFRKKSMKDQSKDQNQECVIM